MAEIRSHLDRFPSASLRGVTAVKDGWVCMSFSQAGQVVRLRLPVEDARHLAGFLGPLRPQISQELLARLTSCPHLEHDREVGHG